MSLNKLFCMVFIVCAISQVYSLRIVKKNPQVNSRGPNRDIKHIPKTTIPDPNLFTPKPPTPPQPPQPTQPPQPPRRNESPLGREYRNWGNFKYNLADGYESVLRNLGYKNPTIIGGLLRLCGKYTHDYADYIDNYYG